jgi:tetratricopeptide (TPR) repeat protein
VAVQAVTYQVGDTGGAFRGGAARRLVRAEGLRRSRALDVAASRADHRAVKTSQPLDELASTWRRWLVSGESRAGHEVLTQALAADARPSRERAICLYADGLFLFRLGEQEASRERNEEALAVAREVGDLEAESLSLVGLSRVAFRDDRHDEVVELARRARELAARVGPEAEVAPLHMQAAGTRLLADYDRAAELYGESMKLERRLGNERGVAMEQHNLAHVELHRGNVDEAARLFSARLEYARAAADPYEHAMTALNEAAVAAAGGNDEQARDRFAEAKRLLDENAIVLDPDDTFEFDSLAARFN